MVGKSPGESASNDSLYDFFDDGEETTKNLKQDQWQDNSSITENTTQNMTQFQSSMSPIMETPREVNIDAGDSKLRGGEFQNMKPQINGKHHVDGESDDDKEEDEQNSTPSSEKSNFICDSVHHKESEEESDPEPDGDDKIVEVKEGGDVGSVGGDDAYSDEFTSDSESSGDEEDEDGEFRPNEYEKSDVKDKSEDMGITLNVKSASEAPLIISELRSSDGSAVDQTRNAGPEARNAANCTGILWHMEGDGIDPFPRQEGSHADVAVEEIQGDPNQVTNCLQAHKQIYFDPSFSWGHLLCKAVRHPSLTILVIIFIRPSSDRTYYGVGLRPSVPPTLRPPVSTALTY